MSSYTWPAIVTFLNIVLLLWVGALVGQARSKYQIAAPATTGNPMFERTFRVQMNTIESTVVFLPSVWLAALYGASALIGAAGLLWIAGRVLYAHGYRLDPARRGPGYGVSSVALAVVLLDAAIRMGRDLLTA